MKIKPTRQQRIDGLKPQRRRRRQKAKAPRGVTRNVERKLKDVGLAEMAERAGAVGIDIKASDVLGRGGKKDDIAVKFIIRGFTVATWHLESGRLYLDGRDRFALTPTEALDQVLPHAT